MLRLSALALVVLVGCVAPDPVGDTAVPDAATCSDIGAFEIAAPRPGLTYTPSMVVYVDESELWAELSLRMVDDLGTAYDWVHDDSVPYGADAGPWWRRDSFSYELAPGRRYSLTVAHCSTQQTVTFFTSAP